MQLREFLQHQRPHALDACRLLRIVYHQPFDPVERRQDFLGRGAEDGFTIFARHQQIASPGGFRPFKRDLQVGQRILHLIGVLDQRRRLRAVAKAHHDQHERDDKKEEARDQARQHQAIELAFVLTQQVASRWLPGSRYARPAGTFGAPGMNMMGTQLIGKFPCR